MYAILIRLGPPIRYWTMRFEGKNKEVKRDGQHSNFKNICKTVADHHQRRHCIELEELFHKNPVSIGTCELWSVI